MTRNTWRTRSIRCLATLVVVLGLSLAPAASAADRAPARAEEGFFLDLSQWMQAAFADALGWFEATWSDSEATGDPIELPPIDTSGGGDNGTDEGPGIDPDG